jgi:hypothetical protein
MALGPIPFTAILEYSRLYDVGESFDDFLYLIRVMDNTILELEEKRSKAQQSAKVKNNGGKHSSKKNHSNR